MICVTSDIHHMSLHTGNQQHSDRAETCIAAEFTSLLAQRDVRLTCFITGKCFEEEWSAVQPICKSENTEIGGHTYNCFMPELWHRGCKKLFGSYNGPRWQQNWDIAKTKRIIQQKAGITITSWRNHMYMHGPYTEELLVKNGIEVCCDNVKRDSVNPSKHHSGLYNLPLNIIPDHEHLYHAERTPEWVENWQRRYDWKDDYGSESYYFEQWFEIFKQGILEREKAGITSQILIHPITIYLAGGQEGLHRIADFLAKFESEFVTDYVRDYQAKRQSLSQNLTQTNLSK